MRPNIPPPKKALGQNFLTDPNYIRKIVEAAEVSADETVLEIGPGHGLLTRALAQRARRVIAIELDRTLIARLRERLSELGNLTLIHADALTFDYGSVEGPLKVVANLPYYIATPLIFRLLEAGAGIGTMVLMVQREVARRIVAQPGGKDYGVLSVAIRFDADARLILNVPRTCFFPRPKVESAVIRLKVLPHPRCPVRDRNWFFEVLRAGFAHRRKFLLNALAARGLPADSMRPAFQRAGIDPKRRAETLSLEEFGKLADQLFDLKGEMC